MNETSIPLEVWARNLWGEHAPSIYTLRRWARDAKIFPLPEKIGRTYFVKPNAEYVRDYNEPRLVSRIRDTSKAQ